MSKALHRITLISLILAQLASCTSLPGATSASTPSAPNSGKTLKALKQIPTGKSPHGIGATGTFVYNADSGADTITVIDTQSDSVVKTLTLTNGTPGYIKAFHDGKQVLALDTQNGTVQVIDPQQGHKILQSVPVGQKPDKIVIGEDDRTAYFSLSGENKVVALTFAEDRSAPPKRQEWATGKAQLDAHRPLAEAGEWLLTNNPGDNDCQLINITSGQGMRLQDGNQPSAITMGTASGVAKVAVVGNTASNTVSLFDIPSGQKTTLVDVGLAPTDAVIDSVLGRAYVTMAGTNDVAVIDYMAKKLLTRIPVGKRPVHIYLAPAYTAPALKTQHEADAVAHEIWVGNDSGDSVTVINGETNQVVATIPTDKGHHKMAFSGSKAYVSNITSNTISVIDRTQIPKP